MCCNAFLCERGRQSRYIPSSDPTLTVIISFQLGCDAAAALAVFETPLAADLAVLPALYFLVPAGFLVAAALVVLDGAGASEGCSDARDSGVGVETMI